MVALAAASEEAAKATTKCSQQLGLCCGDPLLAVFVSETGPSALFPCKVLSDGTLAS